MGKSLRRTVNSVMASIGRIYRDLHHLQFRCMCPSLRFSLSLGFFLSPVEDGHWHPATFWILDSGLESDVEAGMTTGQSARASRNRPIGMVAREQLHHAGHRAIGALGGLSSVSVKNSMTKPIMAPTNPWRRVGSAHRKPRFRSFHSIVAKQEGVHPGMDELVQGAYPWRRSCGSRLDAAMPEEGVPPKHGGSK